MTTFNTTMTIEEATVIFNFKGATMFPKTAHNIKTMATLIEAKLKQLQNK